jgi:hypothetical protein
VVERRGVQLEPGPGVDEAVMGDGVLPDLDRHVGGAGSAQAIDVLLAGGGEVEVDRVLGTVEREPLEHAGQTEAVVAVEVGDADAGDRARRDPGQGELTLGALAGIEKDPLVVPAQERPVVGPLPGGHLGGSPEDHQLPHRHLALLLPQDRSAEAIVGAWWG